MTAIDRRSLIAGLASALAFRPVALGHASSDHHYASCRVDENGSASFAVFDVEGREIFSAALPERGHDAVARPGTTEVAVFARRPGAWFISVDLARGRVLRTVPAAPGRHFYGHGVYSPDGRLLIATENEIETGEGRLGLYDATDGYRRIGEFASYGIGPHDIALMPEGTMLVVANGGLRTQPDTGREILNHDDIEPSLAFVNLSDGRLHATVVLERDYRALSIRHLTVSPTGTVCFGCQYEGDPNDLPPLVGEVDSAGVSRFFDMPEPDLVHFDNYVGSVETDRDARVLLASSPRGNCLAAWDMTTRRYIGRHDMLGVCGLAPASSGRRLMATSGNEGLALAVIGGRGLVLDAAPYGRRWVWDNHAIAV